MWKPSLIFLGVAALCGCSAQFKTSYEHPYVQKGGAEWKRWGYTDEKLGEGHYCVRFAGGEHTPRPLLVEYVKRRASELCGPAGYDIHNGEVDTFATDVDGDPDSLYLSAMREGGGSGRRSCTFADRKSGPALTGDNAGQTNKFRSVPGSPQSFHVEYAAFQNAEAEISCKSAGTGQRP